MCILMPLHADVTRWDLSRQSNNSKLHNCSVLHALKIFNVNSASQRSAAGIVLW